MSISKTQKEDLEFLRVTEPLATQWNEWKNEFIAKFGWKEWLMIERGREKIIDRIIQNLEIMYKKTGNKKYLHALSKFGVDADYLPSDNRG